MHTSENRTTEIRRSQGPGVQNKLPIHIGKKNFKVIEKRLTQTLSMKLIDPNFMELCCTFRSLDLGKTNRKIYSINDQTCSSFQLNTQPKHQTLNGLHYK